MLNKAIRLCCLGLILFVPSARAQNKPISYDLNPIKESILKANQLLKDGKIVECVELIEKSTIEIQELSKNGPGNEMVEIKKVHAELAKTHQRLAVQGAELNELPTWESLLKSKKSIGNKKPDERKPGTPGTESSPISFSKDIAPWLVEQCSRCHINAERGGLSLATFNSIVKGSKGGIVLFPGDPIGSRLVEIIETGDMPRSGNKVSPENLAKLKQWVKEGATFDGLNKDSKLDQVVSQAFVSNANHSELMAKRVERSRKRWKTAFPKGEPNEAMDEHFHVIGNIGEEGTKNLLAQANTVSTQLRKLLKLPNKEPLIKGGVTIFALKLRNDYSEFGKMIESRTLPAEWSSHWRKEVLDSYVAIVVDKAEHKINETSLLQQLTSLWVGAQEGVPRWFADGAGRQALALSVGANDLRVQPWLKRIPDSMTQMKNLKALSDGTMNDEALATIGFGVIRAMYDAKMKPQYELILRSLANGMNFDQATTKSIGSMDLFLQKLLGKGK